MQGHFAGDSTRIWCTILGHIFYIFTLFPGSPNTLSLTLWPWRNARAVDRGLYPHLRHYFGTQFFHFDPFCLVLTKVEFDYFAHGGMPVESTGDSCGVLQSTTKQSYAWEVGVIFFSSPAVLHTGAGLRASMELICWVSTMNFRSLGYECWPGSSGHSSTQCWDGLESEPPFSG